MLFSLGGSNAAALLFFHVPLFAPLETNVAWTYGRGASITEVGPRFLMGGTFTVSERAASLP